MEKRAHPFLVQLHGDVPNAAGLAARYARCPGTLVSLPTAGPPTTAATDDLACDLLDVHASPAQRFPCLSACPGSPRAVALPVRFAAGAEEGERLLRFLKRRHITSCVRNFYLFEPACARLFEIVGSGALGPLNRVTCDLYDDVSGDSTGRSDAADAAADRLAAILDVILRLLPESGKPEPILNRDDRTLSFTLPRGLVVTIRRRTAASAQPDGWTIAGGAHTLHAEITPGLPSHPDAGETMSSNRVWLELGSRRRDYPVPEADPAALFLSTLILSLRQQQPAGLLSPHTALRTLGLLADAW